MVTIRRPERVSFRLPVVVGTAATALVVMVAVYGDVTANSRTVRLASIAATGAFVAIGIAAVRASTNRLFRVLQPVVGAAHASLVRIVGTLSGVLLVTFVAFGLLHIPVQHLLVGGAATGIVVGIAAQQTLSNLFAGVVLLVARPFDVGEQVTVTSGALGGAHRGKVAAVGLTYLLLDANGTLVRLPNAGVLAAAVETEPAERASS